MAATAKVSLKLFIDKKGQRVLFAEADKEFVDFLYSIFTLPVGAVTKLLKDGGGMVGSLPSLYESIENLSVTRIFQPDKKKRFLSKPMVFMPGAKIPLLLPNVGSTFHQFYTCYERENNTGSNAFGSPAIQNGFTRSNAFGSPEIQNCFSHVADDDTTICPSCQRKMDKKVGFVNPPSEIKASSSEEGYVKQTATYMVMDDMEVKPLTSTSLVPLLTKFNDSRDIKEKVVDVGMDEGVKLLQASLQSKTVLTDVFLPAKIVITEETIKTEAPVFRSCCKGEAST